MSPLQDDEAPEGPARFPEDLQAVPLQFADRPPCQPRHLPHVGREDGGGFSFLQDVGAGRQGRETVPVDEKGPVQFCRQVPGKLGRLLVQGQAGAEDDEIRTAGRFENRIQAVRGKGPRFRFPLGVKDDLASFPGDDGNDRTGGGEPGIAAAGPEKGLGGQKGAP